MSAGQQDRYLLASSILDRLAPELAAEGYDLVDVRIFRGGGRQQVRLYVDLLGEARIDLDGCAGASRSASMLLEAADLFDTPWILEVSSPGVRPPLRREDHFRAVVGSDVQVKWRLPHVPSESPQSLRGRLVEVDSGQLAILPAGHAVGQEGESGVDSKESGVLPSELVVVPLAAVLEANLDQDFDAQAVIRQDRRQRKESKQVRRAARRQRSAGASRRAAATGKNSREGDAALDGPSIESGDDGTPDGGEELGGHRAMDARFRANELDERDGN